MYRVGHLEVKGTGNVSVRIPRVGDGDTDGAAAIAGILILIGANSTSWNRHSYNAGQLVRWSGFSTLDSKRRKCRHRDCTAPSNAESRWSLRMTARKSVSGLLQPSGLLAMIFMNRVKRR